MGKEVGRRGGGRGERRKRRRIGWMCSNNGNELFMSSFIRLSGLLDMGSVAIPETYPVSKFCFFREPRRP